MEQYFIGYFYRWHFPLYSLFFLACSACKYNEEAIQTQQHAIQGTIDAVISQDAQFAIVSSLNHGVSYWNLKKNKRLFTWNHDNKNEAITLVGLSADNLRAITASQRNFALWNTQTGKAYGFWKAPDSIRAIAISNRARYVLLGLKNGLVIHLDMKTGRRLEFTGHRLEAISSVALSANGLWAFTGGNDYRGILWNTKTGIPKRLFEHKTRVVYLMLNQKGTLAFTAGTLGNAYIWDLTNGEQISHLQLKKREYVITSARFSHDNNYLVTGAPGKDIRLWSVKKGAPIKRWQARTRNQWKPSGAIVYAVAFSKKDHFIYSESSAGYSEQWKVH
jgi:WD40 repeat protein